MSTRDALTVLSGLAVLLTSSALFPVFEGGAWVVRTALGVAAVVGALLLARQARVPVVLQPALGLLALAAYAVVVFAGETLHHVLLPGADTIAKVRELLDAAASDVESYAAPVPVSDGITLLAVLGVGVVAVVVDAVAVLARRPAVAGLPLMVLFVVPSAVVEGRLGALPFALAAAGWLALLLTEGRERVGRWGAPLRAASSSYDDPAGLGRVGRRLGAAALGVAVVVPVLLPGLDGDLLGGGGSGDGLGDGSANVSTYNPLTRLRGQLNQPDPAPILTYVTNDPAPDYLRMTTLGEYDEDGWRAAELTGTVEENGVDRPLPRPPGQSELTPTRPVEARISVETLQAFWLPLPFPPSRVEVEGPWMWDPRSQSVFAVRSDTQQVEPYTVRVDRVLPDPVALDRERTGPLPGDVEPYDEAIEVTDAVRALTEQVVEGADTDYARAAAIQAFFTDPDEGFTYDLQTASGGSPDALQDFLEQRRGFCEQYASAMAAMLRVAGVPSRVAVGFTPGTAGADGVRLVTTDEAHAWPEAWFAGAGWVRFEPTPASGGITAPTYTSPDAEVPTAPDAAPAPLPAPLPGDADESPQQRRERLESEALARRLAAGEDVTPDGAGIPVALLVGVVVVAAVLASPAALHTARRRRRWAHPSPSVAWTQLHDDATDVGHRWRAAESPRVAGARLRQERVLLRPGREALDRLVAAVERARYAPDRPAADAGAAEVLHPVAALDGEAVALDRQGVAPDRDGAAQGLPAGVDLGAAPGRAPAGVSVLARPAAVSPEQAEALHADVAAVREALLASSPRAVRVRARLLPPSTLRWASQAVSGAIADALDGVDRLLARATAPVRRALRRR